MRYSILICILVSATAMTSFGQAGQGKSLDSSSTETMRPEQDSPLIFLNDVNANQGKVDTIDPTEIAFITVVNDTVATDASSPGTQGAIYVYTKEYARSKYWNFFKQKSPAYANAIPSLEEEKNVAYIVDGKVLIDNLESELYDLMGTDIQLEMIDGKQLKKQFHVKNKKLGVVIVKEGSR